MRKPNRFAAFFYKYVYKNFQVLNDFYLIDFQTKANYQLTTINCPLT